MSIIEHLLVTGKAMDQMDFDNKFQFIIHIGPTKSDVKLEVESRYDVTVEKVNTQAAMEDRKKATVRPSKSDDMQETTLHIGVL